MYSILFECGQDYIWQISLSPLRPRWKKSTDTRGLDNLTSWCWHNTDFAMTIMPNSRTPNSIPTKLTHDGASSQQHNKRGGRPGIEQTVETLVHSCNRVVSSPTSFQMVDMLMVLIKTTTSAPSSSHSFSPHSFLSMPHTPDSPSGHWKVLKLFIVHTFSALPIAILGCFKVTITYLSFLIHIFLSSRFISALFKNLTIYIHPLLGGYWVSSLSRI